MNAIVYYFTENIQQSSRLHDFAPSTNKHLNRNNLKSCITYRYKKNTVRNNIFNSKILQNSSNIILVTKIY